MFKKEVRIIAWDDCTFKKRTKRVLLVGAIFRGGQFLDGLLSVRVEKDGLDATEKIARAITKSRHNDQLSIIMLDGITFAGFNIVDVQELNRRTGMPVLVVQRSRPDLKKFLQAMRKINNLRARRTIAKKAGPIRKYGEIYYQSTGLAPKEAEELLRLTCTRSKIPEPVRAAHLIASGLSRRAGGFNESKGRA